MRRTSLPRPCYLSAPLLCALLAVLPAALGLAGCGGDGGNGAEPPAEVAEPQRVENASVDVAVVIPAGSPFELESNDGDEIRLRYPGYGEFGPGTVTYRADPEQYFGVNLVNAVNDRKAEVEKLPNGVFLGQVELGGPLGPAFSTRVRYTDAEGHEVEEVRIFTVHPKGNRLLYMTYRYEAAPGQTKERLQDQAFEAFGYLEPLGGESGTGADGTDGEAGTAVEDEAPPPAQG